MDLSNFASQAGIQTYGSEYSKYQALATDIERNILDNIQWKIDEMFRQREEINMDDHVKQLIENQTIQYTNLKSEVERKVQLMIEDFNKVKDGVENVVRKMQATFDEQKKQLVGEMRILFHKIVEDKTSIEAKAFLDLLERA